MFSRFRHFFLGLVALVLAGSLLGCDTLLPWTNDDSQKSKSLKRCTPATSTRGPVGEWKRLMSGREITAVAADPCDPRVIYAGSAEGLFKSSDGGASWDSLSVGGDVDLEDLEDLEVEPYRPDTIYAQQDTGPLLLESGDGGATWKEVRGGGFHSPGGAMELAPENPGTLYVGGGGNLETVGHIAKSTDGGESWEHLVSNIGEPVIISISPADPQVVYVANRATYGPIMSTDEGKSWVDPSSASDVILVDLVVSPADAGLLYGVDVETRRRVVRSRDSAHTWNTVETGLPPGKALRLAADSATGELFLLHQVEPEARSARVYRWDEKEEAWRRFDSDPLEAPVSARTLVVARERSLYLGTKGGLWRMKLGPAE